MQEPKGQHGRGLPNFRDGMGRYGTGRFWKIHVSNYRDAGTVTENSILPKVQNHRKCNLPKVRDEQDCIMKASILLG